jgi:hypothetical protein
MLSGPDASEDPDHVHAAAARGTATAATQLPHFEQIQRAFGRHDVSGIKAHAGGAAPDSARAMGAEAMTRDLRTGPARRSERARPVRRGSRNTPAPAPTPSTTRRSCSIISRSACT